MKTKKEKVIDRIFDVVLGIIKTYIIFQIIMGVITNI